MTFYAKELIFNRTETAWNAIQSDMTVRRNLYSLVGDTETSRPLPNHMQGSLNSGLFFIRPICSVDSSGKGWLSVGDDVASPAALGSLDTVKLDVRQRDVQIKTCLCPEGFQDAIPLSVLHYAKALSGIIGSPVVFYDACYWGGMIEYELAWIFDGEEEAIVRLADSRPQNQICRIKAGSQTETTGEVLQIALSTLGVNISGGFFLPHTRDFNWAERKVR